MVSVIAIVVRSILAHIEVKVPKNADPNDMHALVSLRFMEALGEDRETNFQQSWDEVKQVLRFDYCLSG